MRYRKTSCFSQLAANVAKISTRVNRYVPTRCSQVQAPRPESGSVCDGCAVEIREIDEVKQDAFQATCCADCRFANPAFRSYGIRMVCVVSAECDRHFK